MSAIEIMALILVLFSGVKIITLLTKPEFWINKIAKKVWVKTGVTIFISLIIAIISLLFLLEELTIVQIFAVIFFFMSLMVISIAPYIPELLNLISQKISKGSILKENWLAILIWGILSIWVLISLFK